MTTRRFDFNEYIDRRDSDSGKWLTYDEDVLPLWVADMDFRSPEPILQALQERLDHGVFGYGRPPEELKTIICERMYEQHSWQISPEDVTFLPGLVSGLNVVARAIGERGDGILMTTPIYPPFLTAPIYQHRELQTAQMAVTKRRDGRLEHLWYDIDFDALQRATTASTRLFMLCNPHNPVGRAFTREELLALADFCERYDLTVCSDDNHCDLLLGGAQYTPIASLSPETAKRTITLIAPSKTFNLAGLKCGIAITQNPELRKLLQAASVGIVSQVNVFGYVAALAAYRDCGDWVTALRDHLTGNRDFLAKHLTDRLPEVDFTFPEATYLMWIDCRRSGIQGSPQKFFLERARVALNDGIKFGEGGKGFVRLNFGCTRVMLEQALAQISHAMTGQMA